MGFFGRSEKKHHAHFLAVFFFSLVSIGLLIGALNIEWYQITSTYSISSTVLLNTTITYDFIGETSVTVSPLASTTKNTAWKDLNSPHQYSIYQSVQSFSTIAVILAGAVAFGAIVVGCCKCFSDGLRDVVKVLVSIVSLAAIAFCILSWAVLLGQPKAIAEDYSSNNGGATCNSGPCTSFMSSQTSSVVGATNVQTWGPFTAFWLVIGATASSLIVFLEIVREARC